MVARVFRIDPGGPVRLPRKDGRETAYDRATRRLHDRWKQTPAERAAATGKAREDGRPGRFAAYDRYTARLHARCVTTSTPDEDGE